MENLNVDPKTLFKALFLAQMPPDVRKILATSSKTEVKDLATEADKIVEASKLSQSSEINKVGPPVRGPPVRGPPWKPPPTPGKCWYHARFGEKATYCRGTDVSGKPCLMRKPNQPNGPGNANASR